MFDIYKNRTLSQAGASGSGGSGGSGVQTLTGNSGGAVSPTVGNINVVGSGIIAVAGNPGTSTLTASITNPIPIANGGTNATSMATTDGVVYYDGTRLVTTSAGTAGQVLTSNGAGVAPTYQAAGGGGGGPAFFAYLANTASNVTGDFSTFTFIPDTIIFDRTSNYNTGTGLFTAPTTGIYSFQGLISFNDPGSLILFFSTTLFVTGTSAYSYIVSNISAVPGTGYDTIATQWSLTVAMTAGDTAHIESIGGNAAITKTMSALGTINPPAISFFSGFLVA